MDLMTALRALTVSPANVMGLDVGRLTIGGLADVAIFDPNANWEVGTETWLSQGRNTPYWGQRLTGRMRYTLLGGKCVFESRGN